MNQSSASPAGKWLVWIITAAVLAGAALAWWYFSYRSVPAPLETVEAPPPLTGGDTTPDIEQNLEAIDLGDVGAELDQLDPDINQL